MKELYVLQPYEVGSRRAKSLALVIPAKVVKEYKIGTSTVFALSTNSNTKRIVLQQTPYPMEEKKPDQAVIAAGDRLKASRNRNETVQ
jgi:hypothetical protein